MNREQYESLKATIQNFDQTYVFDVDPSLVYEDPATSQIRQKGAVIAKVPAMVADIEKNGQEVPADVRMMPDGTFELKDGVTRWLSQKKISDGKLKVSVYHDTIFTNEDDWAFHQIKANEHETSTSNSSKDIAFQVEKLWRSGALERKLGYRYLSNESAFMKAAPALLKNQIYKRASVTKKSLENYLKKCVNSSSKVKQRYHNYTKGPNGTCWETFTELNVLGWSGNKANDICNNVAIYGMYDAGEVKDIAGYVWMKASKNPNAKYYLLAWVGNLSNKNDEGIKKERQRIYDCYKQELQNHPKFGMPMFDGIFFLPQIKTGQNKEVLQKLYLPQELNLT